MYYQQDLAVYFQSGGGEIHLFLLKTPLRFLSLFVREPREDNRENGGRGVRVENPVGESHLKLLTTFKGKKRVRYGINKATSFTDTLAFSNYHKWIV